VISSRNLLGLRHIPAEEVVFRYEDATTELFDTAGQMETPNVVVIPARNEQLDLPATLLTLSRSTVPVVPIVVENGSDPEARTCEYAARMGAIVLRCEPAKMRATQVGLSFARKHFPAQPLIHFGDADNLYPSFCIASMARVTRRANKRNNGNGAAVFGLVAFDHGPSIHVDLAQSVHGLRKAIQSKLTGRPPMPCGANYALHVDENGELSEALYGLNPLLFVREETEICKAVHEIGAVIRKELLPSTYVFTRGNLTREEWKHFKGGSMDKKVAPTENDMVISLCQTLMAAAPIRSAQRKAVEK